MKDTPELKVRLLDCLDYEGKSRYESLCQNPISNITYERTRGIGGGEEEDVYGDILRRIAGSIYKRTGKVSLI
jgi:hypothetical protein